MERVPLLLRWMAELRLPHAAVDLGMDFRDGVVLCLAVSALAPAARLGGITMKPLSQRAALKNIEEVLNVLRRKTNRAKELPPELAAQIHQAPGVTVIVTPPPTCTFYKGNHE